MDTARPWPSRPPGVAVLALFSIFLISTDSYYMHTHNKGLNTHKRKTLCVRVSVVIYGTWGVFAFEASSDWPLDIGRRLDRWASLDFSEAQDEDPLIGLSWLGTEFDRGKNILE